MLDRYPPKDPSLTVRGPPAAAATSPPPARATTGSVAPGPGVEPSSGSTPAPLIRLEAPFDLDEFSTLLGETSIRVTVPREDLPEVLRRITEFMGFGIYVYSISVKPSPTETLKSFEVELQRVDFHPAKRAWIAFEEKGTSSSPFGPSGTRT